MFGKLNYSTFDKVDEKYKYNQLTENEYAELLEKNNLLLVRPSCGNMHKFIAQEDSCFFDICLPNYTQDSLRRITYFNEVGEHLGCDGHDHSDKEEAHVKTENSCEGTTLLEYDTTPPTLPNGFEVQEVAYRGEMTEDQIMARLV